MKIFRWILAVLPLLLFTYYVYLMLFDESVGNDYVLSSFIILLTLLIVAFMLFPIYPQFDYWRKAFWIGAGIGIGFVLWYIESPLSNLMAKIYFLDPFAYLACHGECQDVEGMVHFVTIPLSYGLYGLIIATLLKKFRKTV